MRIIGLPAGAGKTTQMLEWLTERNTEETRILAVATAEEAHTHRRRLAQEGREVADWQIMPAAKFLTGMALAGLLRPVVVGIDDLERVLPALLGCSTRIGPVSFTTQEGHLATPSPGWMTEEQRKMGTVKGRL